METNISKETDRQETKEAKPGEGNAFMHLQSEDAFRNRIDQDPLFAILAGFLNNKMTIWLLWVQQRKPQASPELSRKAVCFFQDVFHHMIRKEYQARYFWIFKWLQIFFMRFPDVNAFQRVKAIKFLDAFQRIIYLSLHKSMKEKDASYDSSAA